MGQNYPQLQSETSILQNLVRTLRENIRYQEFIALSFVLAFILVSFPLQRHIEISRYQHYSFGLYTIAVGFLIQAVWSWRQVNRWGRVTLVCASIYFTVFASFFYTNPWLGNADLATEQQLAEKQNTAISLLVAAIPLCIVWIVWNSEQDTSPKRKTKSSKNDDGSEEGVS